MAEKLSPRMTETEVWDFVRDGHTGIFTTLRRDGMPIAMPMWYCCLDRTVYMQTRGRKLQRIQHDPRTSFLVESGDIWAEMAAVHLTGRAEHIESPSNDLEAAFGAEMERKYRAFRGTGLGGARVPKQVDEYYAAQMRGLVRFVPDDRVLHWDNAKMMS